MKKELTIEHLSVYLPHKVKVKINGMIKELVCNTISDSHLNQGLYIGIPNLLGVHGVNGRLLLRHLSQLTETIEHPYLGIKVKPIDSVRWHESAESVTRAISDGDFEYESMIYLHSLHFDTFGLIDSGLAEPIPSIPQQ